MELEKEEEKILGETVLSWFIYPTYDRSASPFVPTAAIHTHEFFFAFWGRHVKKMKSVCPERASAGTREFELWYLYLHFPFLLVQFFIVFNHFMNCVCVSKTVQPHGQ